MKSLEDINKQLVLIQKLNDLIKESLRDCKKELTKIQEKINEQRQ